MIDQVAKSKFVMPFNLRKDSDGQNPIDRRCQFFAD
jgi:hypothetical protein